MTDRMTYALLGVAIGMFIVAMFWNPSRSNLDLPIADSATPDTDALANGPAFLIASTANPYTSYRPIGNLPITGNLPASEDNEQSAACGAC